MGPYSDALKYGTNPITSGIQVADTSTETPPTHTAARNMRCVVYNIVTRLRDYRRGLDWWLDLLDSYNSYLQISITVSLILTLHSSLSTQDYSSQSSLALPGNGSPTSVFSGLRPRWRCFTADSTQLSTVWPQTDSWTVLRSPCMYSARTA
jgi:hypothetical protein